jgi:hypothetical protein
MPMLNTPKNSPISQYSPYLYAYPVNADGSAYNGQYAVGTSGGASNVYTMFGPTPSGIQSIAACVDQIRINGKTIGQITDVKDRAKFARMQIDNCTNQYVLYAALGVYQKENTKLINNAEISADPINLETECQPLATFTELDNDDYHPSDYLLAAWTKTVQDPKYRYTQKFKLPAGLDAFAKVLNIPVVGGGQEPSLPSGVTLASPLTPPNDPATGKFPQVLLSSISAVPYEEINDPTHPFSPRWDYLYADRDLSIMTKTYLTDDASKNSVYCAGVKEAKNESDAQKKADLEVHVDVLGFRRDKFENGIFRRIGYNSLCKVDTLDQKTDIISAAALSYCFKPDTSTITSYLSCVTTETAASYGTGALLAIVQCYQTAEPKATIQPCWKCYGLGSDKVDDDNKHPPCATRYDGVDQTMPDTAGFPSLDSKNFTLATMLKAPLELLKFIKALMTGSQVAGALNAFSNKATCNLPYTGHDDNYNIDKICHDLRRPYTSLNKLKMRYHNPNETDNNVLTNGVMEGLTFKEYFGNHMPYPRMWDTGLPLLKSNGSDRNNQPPDDTTGQYTAIVGVGREAAAKVIGNDSNGDSLADKHKDERCMLGGWGSGNGITGLVNNTLNPLINGQSGALNGPLNNTINQAGVIMENDARLAVNGAIGQATQTISNTVNDAVNGTIGQISSQARLAVTAALQQTAGQSASAVSNAVQSALSGTLGQACTTISTSATGAVSSSMQTVNTQMGQSIMTQMNTSLGNASSSVYGNAGSSINTTFSGLNSQISTASTTLANSGSGVTQNDISTVNATLSSSIATANQTMHTYMAGSLNGSTGQSSQQMTNAVYSVLGAQNTASTMINGQINSAVSTTCVAANQQVYSAVNQALSSTAGQSQAQIDAAVNNALANSLGKYTSLMNTSINNALNQSVGKYTGELSNQLNSTLDTQVGKATNSMKTAASDALSKGATAATSGIQSAMQQLNASGMGNTASQLLNVLNKVSFAGISIQLPDPITSWTELKLYQARALRYMGLSCIARYEKAFKAGNSENLALMRTGGEWQSLYIYKCPINNPTPATCKYVSLAEKQADLANGASANYTYKEPQGISAAWSNGWRGYIGSADVATRFPNFGGGAANTSVGLDNAQPGDIIVMPNGVVSAKGEPGLPTIAVVEDVNLPTTGNKDCAAKKNCYVLVREADNGRAPDVCGTTDNWGYAPERYYYKPGQESGGTVSTLKAEFDKLNWTTDCADTKLNICVFAQWNSAQLYHISDDYRPGCTDANPNNCK